MEKNIIDYLEAAEARFSEKTAYEDQNGQISFEELHCQLHQIAAVTAGLGLRRKPVAIFMEKGIPMITAMLGVVVSGNFYCPIDVEMPAERIQKILQILQPQLLITNEAQEAFATDIQPGCQILILERDLLSHQVTKEEALLLKTIRRTICREDPLYVLFTSGSTGAPKGVVSPHRVVMNYLDWLEEDYGLNQSDILGNQAPFYFVISIADLFGPLKFGCTTVLIPKEFFSFPVKLLEYMNEKQVTAAFFVPFVLGIVASLRGLDVLLPNNLRVLFFGGEVLPMKQFHYWKQHLPKVRYVNMYGSTEAVGTLAYEVRREFEDREMLPIGTPIRNVDFMILDEWDHLVVPQTGAKGELCVRGDALALGYYRCLEADKERFTLNPLQPDFEERIYRTGDLVRCNEQGELTYLSRKDFQIKHLGYRIELGEIEQALRHIPQIQEGICMYDQEKRAIVLVYSGMELEKKDILKQLRELVPIYMLPGRVFFTEILPHLPSGKADRKQLESLWLRKRKQ